MAKTEHYTTRLEPKGIYHIYNRAVGKQQLFTSPANYQFFLDRIKKYLVAVVDVYAYCLLGNHFHLLIRVREGESHKTVSHAFQQMFQSYALAFNKQEGRVGTLFQTPFKRAEVHTEAYFHYLVWYIHSNAQHHGLVKDFRQWPYSSYHSLLSDRPTLLLRDELLQGFGGREAFIAFHEAWHDMLGNDEMLEDW